MAKKNKITEISDISFDWVGKKPIGNPVFCEFACYDDGILIHSGRCVFCVDKSHLINRIFRGSKKTNIDSIKAKVIMQWVDGNNISITKSNFNKSTTRGIKQVR